MPAHMQVGHLEIVTMHSVTPECDSTFYSYKYITTESYWHCQVQWRTFFLTGMHRSLLKSCHMAMTEAQHRSWVTDFHCLLFATHNAATTVICWLLLLLLLLATCYSDVCILKQALGMHWSSLYLLSLRLVQRHLALAISSCACHLTWQWLNGLLVLLGLQAPEASLVWA